MALDKVKSLKRVIIVSWVTLIVCFLIKIFGGNFFVIMCENERFIAVCEYADKNIIANYIISFVFGWVSNYFFTLAILEKVKYNRFEFIVVTITMAVGTAIKMSSVSFGWIFDIWQTVFMHMIFLGKNYKKYIRIPIGIALILIFQILSLVIKDIGITTLGNSILIEIIFSIDVLLMEMLYFSYTNILRKEKE